VSRVPPHASGSPPGADELEQLEELGDDAIIAQQQGAHAPKPRVLVTEEARSVVISDHPAPGSHPPSDPRIPPNSGAGTRKRSDRTEKTVVIRDRRQVEELRRQMAKRAPRSNPAPAQGNLVLWVVVGALAFLAGGLVALFATREDGASAGAPASSASAVATPPASPTATTEPPSVSIDELPIEHK
jgi:hypothetical protein